MKESTIEALKYIRDLPGTGIQNAVRDTCRKEQLNDEFINEFRVYITPEMFSTSYMLTGEMANAHPDLFDIEAWKASDTRSMAVLLSENIRSKFTSKEIAEMLYEMNANEMTDELFNTLFESYHGDAREILMQRSPKPLSASFILEHSDCLSSAFFSIGKRTMNLSNSDFEAILKSQSRTMEFFISVILRAKNNDIAWQKRMLSEIGSKIHIFSTAGTFDKTLISAMKELHPTLLDDVLLNVKQYADNALSYTVLEYILQWVELPEDTILELIPYFRRNMLVNALAKYAAENGYSAVILQLATN